MQSFGFVHRCRGGGEVLLSFFVLCMMD
ncbi:hypothetical protein LSH36_277g03014 [Paralvinella palmiformis]|uniref:Uncharacterized protein n=1 Tax=Paralvinella palmiformis TaxID=53620 RepID=A0AAD9JKF8_9ANNE|nr:hypothetical protein LSH36_277g03014 [Paralvinella palmiformis]